MEQSRNLVSALGSAGVYAIKAWVAENLNRNHRNRNTYFLSDSQAVIKAGLTLPPGPRATGWAQQSITDMGVRSWGYWWKRNSRSAGQTRIWRLFIGPELACGIRMGVANQPDWTIRDHRKHWYSLRGLKQAKALIQGPSANKVHDSIPWCRLWERVPVYGITIRKK
jgi:hypothetical protein